MSLYIYICICIYRYLHNSVVQGGRTDACPIESTSSRVRSSRGKIISVFEEQQTHYIYVYAAAAVDTMIMCTYVGLHCTARHTEWARARVNRTVRYHCVVDIIYSLAYAWQYPAMPELRVVRAAVHIATGMGCDLRARPAASSRVAVSYGVRYNIIYTKKTR
jgi:hypothetical protein